MLSLTDGTCKYLRINQEVSTCTSTHEHEDLNIQCKTFIGINKAKVKKLVHNNYNKKWGDKN